MKAVEVINAQPNVRLGLYRERALKRFKRKAVHWIGVYPFILWPALKWVFKAIFAAIFFSAELVEHQEPGKPPLRRHEWEKHYFKSPKIF